MVTEALIHLMNSLLVEEPTGTQIPLIQRFTNEGDLRGYNARVVYTEPILKRSLLEFSLGKQPYPEHGRKGNL
jgi:hypothetical protein